MYNTLANIFICNWTDMPENFFHQQAKHLIEAIESYQIEPEERLCKLVEKIPSIEKAQREWLYASKSVIEKYD